MAELRHDSPEGLSESGKAGAESTTRFFAEIHESCRPSTSQALGTIAHEGLLYGAAGAGIGTPLGLTFVGGALGAAYGFLKAANDSEAQSKVCEFDKIQSILLDQNKK